VDLLINSIAILAGFGLLIWSADRFVDGASATARNLGVSPLVIGLTIVGFGTSAPEMMVSAFAAAGGNPGLAVGNAIGSNITNIALVLGATAVVVPMTVHSSILKREYPLLLLTTVVAIGLLGWDNHLGRTDGILLFMLLFGILFWLVRQSLKNRDSDPMVLEYEMEIPDAMPMKKAVTLLLVGLLVLLLSSRLLVWGAVNIATAFGVSDLIIGLTIVAIGTSLPELAASIASARKNEHDIAIGNVIGSNMFNICGVLGIAGLIHPETLDPGVLSRDLPIMFILTLILFIISFGFRAPGRINRFEGGFLLLVYAAYAVLLYNSITA
jgi:cation:H+ antiporter